MKSKILKLSVVFSLFFISNLTYGQDKVTEFKSIEITGFDKSGEPEMKFYNDGRIELLFKKCPVEDSNESAENDYWTNFEKALTSESNKKVTRNKRTFMVANANEETAKKIEYYLEHYWK